MTNREKFIEIYNSCIKREGADKLLEFITSPERSDFFTAPASGRRHSSFEGEQRQTQQNVKNDQI